MSLTLRKDTQDALNVVGLDDYHTRINENKYLTIVGPCGQPLITISGIEFTRREPTKAEIDFACELFGTFLAENHHEITAYVRMLKKHKQSVKPPEENDIYAIDTIGYGDCEKTVVKYFDHEFLIALRFEDGKAFLSSIEKKESISAQDFLAYAPNQALWMQGTLFLKKYATYKNAENVLEAAKAKLSTCDI